MERLRCIVHGCGQASSSRCYLLGLQNPKETAEFEEMRRCLGLLSNRAGFKGTQMINRATTNVEELRSRGCRSSVHHLSLRFSHSLISVSKILSATTDDNSGRYSFTSSVVMPATVVCAAVKGGSSNESPLEGIVFELVQAVNKELNLVPPVSQ